MDQNIKTDKWLKGYCAGAHRAATLKEYCPPPQSLDPSFVKGFEAGFRASKEELECRE